MLQALVLEKTRLAASAMKEEAEERARDLLSTVGAEGVREKAMETFQAVADSVRGLRAQTEAALPGNNEERAGWEAVQESEPSASSASSPETRGSLADAPAVTSKEGESEALYPPGEIFHIQPCQSPGPAAREGSKEAGRQGAACGYELRRVRDVRFFDGVVISPDMFSAHLLSSVVRSLEALAGEKD
jgi:hypothetical protein